MKQEVAVVGTRQGMDQWSVVENGIVVSTITVARTIGMFKIVEFIEAVKAPGGERQEKDRTTNRDRGSLSERLIFRRLFAKSGNKE